MKPRTPEQWRQIEARQEREKVLRQPGGYALLNARRFLEEEAKTLALIDRATDEGERARLTAQAQEFRATADQSMKEAKQLTMTATAKQIRENTRRRLASVAQKLALIPQSEDEKYPEDHRQTRREQREKLNREWRTIEQQAHAELQQWAQEQSSAAQALHASQPVGTPQEESRRISEELEIQRLAAPLMGQPKIMVTNRLLDQARQHIATGNLDRARVYIEAGRQAGVEDGGLDRALAEALDRTVPTRRQAREQLSAIEVEADGLDQDLVSARIQHSVGNPVANSNAAKILAARRGEGTPAGLVTSSNVAPGAGDGGSASS